MSSFPYSYYDSFISLACEGEQYRFSPNWPPIGTGGMGIVFLGFRVSDNRKVAVKMLRPELTSIHALRQRAKLEASIRLSHPNIVRMLGFCEEAVDRGPLFVLSEYVEGIQFQEYIHFHLKDLTRDERIMRIVKEFMPVLDAVGYLHSLGIIHRDIKPDNIMFENGGIVKLMDLGVAKADSFFDAHLKGTIGTPPFCAPEQVVDPSIEASTDTRSDIYSLGVTLSYLIGGTFPLEKEAVPSELEQILDLATAKYPADRFQFVGHFRDHLNAWVETPSKRTKQGFWKRLGIN